MKTYLQNKYMCIALAAAALFLFSGCLKQVDEGGWEDRGPRRVLLVYMGADNNLSSESDAKLEAILKGSIGFDGDIVIYKDDRDNAKLIHISSSADSAFNNNSIIGEFGKEDHASKEVLERVIGRVKQEYPADIYGLLVFTHASGWLPSGTLYDPYLESSTRSIFRDDGDADASRTEMEIKDFSSVIPDSFFDYIIFEACHMAGVEVVYELRNKCDYILASCTEIVSPGFTRIYESSIRRLFSNKSVQEGLIDFASDYFDHVISDASYYNSASISLIKTAQADRLASVAKRVYASQSEGNIAIDDIQYFDRPLLYGYQPALPRFYDLEEYLSKVSQSGQDVIPSDNIFDDIVVWKRNTDQFLINHSGFNMKNHCGITTYIQHSEFENLNRAYERTSWYLETH